MGIEFKAEEEFPPDDTGYGFDNIGDVLTVSPLLLEKYFQAAETIVKTAVPTVSKLIPERTYRGVEFRGDERGLNGDRLAFTRATTVSRRLQCRSFRRLPTHARSWPFRRGPRPDPGRCKVVFKVGDRELLHESYGSDDNKTFHYTFDQKFSGDQRFTFEIMPHPLAGKTSETGADTQPKSGAATDPKTASAVFRIVSLHVEGPMDPRHWVRPSSYGRFFPKDEPPAADPERRPVCPGGPRPVREEGIPPPGR